VPTLASCCRTAHCGAGSRAGSRTILSLALARLSPRESRGGGILSGVVRNIDNDIRAAARAQCEMYGNDVVYRWGENKYSFTANAALTNVSGDRREIFSEQQSSARYFQRPDRGAGWAVSSRTGRHDGNEPARAGARTPASRRRRVIGPGRRRSNADARLRTNDYAFQQAARLCLVTTPT